MLKLKSLISIAISFIYETQYYFDYAHKQTHLYPFIYPGLIKKFRQSVAFYDSLENEY